MKPRSKYLSSTKKIIDMKSKIIDLVFIFLCFHLTHCNIFNNGFKYLYDEYCNVFECCSDKQVPYNLSSLKEILSTKLYGQHIATEIVVDSIYAHLSSTKTQKPLVLSFHGANGVGKTYTSRIITSAFFKKKEDSNFFHFYYGLYNFPLIEKISEYKAQLEYEIENAIRACKRSLFIFDGVEKMPAGLLDVLASFIDCANCRSKIKENQAIFIFLTNTGSISIQKQLLELMKNGKKRELTTLQDFQDLVISDAKNEKGGLFESELIKKDMIDYHIPFLPLERHHVKLCIRDAITDLNLTIRENLINKVFEELKFVPEPEKLLSESGCKRVSIITGRIITRLRQDFNDFNDKPLYKSEL